MAGRRLIALCMAQLAVATFVPICVLAAAFVYHADVSPGQSRVARGDDRRRCGGRASSRGDFIRGSSPRCAVGLRCDRHVADDCCVDRLSRHRRCTGTGDCRSALQEAPVVTDEEKSLGAGDLDSSGLARDAAAGNRRQRCATGRRRVIRVLHHGEQSGASSVHRRNRSFVSAE